MGQIFFRFFSDSVSIFRLCVLLRTSYIFNKMDREDPNPMSLTTSPALPPPIPQFLRWCLRGVYCRYVLRISMVQAWWEAIPTTNRNGESLYTICTECTLGSRAACLWRTMWPYYEPIRSSLLILRVMIQTPEKAAREAEDGERMVSNRREPELKGWRDGS